MCRPLPSKERNGRQRGTRGSPKRGSQLTTSPTRVGTTGPRMSAAPSGHVGRARHRALQRRPQDDGGGGRSVRR